MKKILCLLCALALLAGLSAGCGATDGPDEPAVTTTAAGVDTTVPEATAGGDSTTSSDWEQIASIFSAQWPENEFTRQVPKPDFEVGLGATATETEFSFICVGTSLDQLREYVKELQQAGFTKNAESTDMLGMYSYTANNGRGYAVTVSSVLGIHTLSISKG